MKFKKIKALEVPPSMRKPYWFENEDGEQELYDPESLKKCIEQCSGVNEELLISKRKK